MKRFIWVALSLVLAMPALADTFYWSLDTAGKPFAEGTTFQLYRDAAAYLAPMTATRATVPDCDPHTYHVIAIFKGQPSIPSNFLISSACVPAAPKLNAIENAKLTACKIDSTKQYMANAVCQGKLKAHGIQ